VLDEQQKKRADEQKKDDMERASMRARANRHLHGAAAVAAAEADIIRCKNEISNAKANWARAKCGKKRNKKNDVFSPKLTALEDQLADATRRLAEARAEVLDAAAQFAEAEDAAARAAAAKVAAAREGARAGSDGPSADG
jgi:hypothetical protein